MSRRETLSLIVLLLVAAAAIANFSTFRNIESIMFQIGGARSAVSRNLMLAIGADSGANLVSVNTTLLDNTQTLNAVRNTSFFDSAFAMVIGSVPEKAHEQAEITKSPPSDTKPQPSGSAESDRLEIAKPGICSDRQYGHLDVLSYNERHGPSLRAFATPLSNGQAYVDGGTAQGKQDAQVEAEGLVF
jgi:hypothetical protein